MMQNILEYKGYVAKVEYSVEDQVLYGKIEGINDFVNFECEDVKKVQEAFQEAVDEYLLFCEEVGKEPDKVYKGSFNVRVSPQLHKQAAQKALKEGCTLNQIVEKALDSYINQQLIVANEMSKIFDGMGSIIKNISNKASKTEVNFNKNQCTHSFLQSVYMAKNINSYN